MSRNHSTETSKLTAASDSSSKRATASRNENTTTNETVANKTKSSSRKYHLNSIWSLWYCVLVICFTSYLVYSGIRRFLLYASLPWPNEEPYMELNAHVGLVGAAVVVMPFFILSSVMKIGNLPNDGFKLGSSLSTCSRDPPSVLQPSTGVIRNLWLHGVPTSPFLHMISAFCLLLPQTLMGAALIRARFLPPSEIWKSDLDVFLPHDFNNSLMTSANNVSNSAILAQNAFDDVMMVRIQGSGKAPVESRPFSQIAGQSWRTKRFASPSFEDEDYPSLNLPGPISEPVRSNEKKNKRKEGSLSSFSPHQEKKVIQKSKNNVTKVKPSPFPPFEAEQLQWKPFSPELVNYALSILVFAIRYPSVFWHTNKLFSFLFSIHLILTGIVTIVFVVAFSVLYKFQVNFGSRLSNEQDSFLSTPLSSLILFILSVMSLTVSSSAVYFYGYQRFASFLHRSRNRFHIMFSDTPLVMRPHTAQLSALAAFICFGLSLGPLLWDFAILYKKSPGSKVLITAIITTAIYLCLWIGLWLFLSFKSSWIFKLRVTVARAFVSSARSIKLVNDVEMSQAENEGSLTPILIVGSGRAVAIKDPAPKKAIMGVVNKIREEKKLKGKEEEIYWLKPTFNSRFDREKLNGRSQVKVTFNEFVEEKFTRRKSLLERPLSQTDDDDDEAGDYAILKSSYQSCMARNDFESSRSNSEVSEQSPTVEDPRYVDRKQILAYQKEAKSLSSTDSSPVLVAPDYEETDHFDDTLQGPPSRYHLFMDTQGSVTPRSTRSNDSGVPGETPSHRSDSISSHSSNSNTPHEISEESGVHCEPLDVVTNRLNSCEELNQLQNRFHHPVFNRSRFSSNSSAPQTTAESTVAIRCQRNNSQEIRPPADPIYSTRKITSFAPSENDSPIPSPVPPMPSLPSLEESGVVGLFPPKHIQSYRGAHNRLNESVYGQRSQYPQLPLPPIPQEMMIPPSMEPLRNTHSDIYGRAVDPHQGGYIQNPSGMYGYVRNVPMGQSSSLRYPSTHGGNIQKQYTNTLPHVLPKDSQYNTNV